MSTSYVFKIMESPVGALKLVASNQGLAAILWENDDPNRVRLTPQVVDEKNIILQKAEQQLQEYFAGKRTSLV